MKSCLMSFGSDWTTEVGFGSTDIALASKSSTVICSFGSMAADKGAGERVKEITPENGGGVSEAELVNLLSMVIIGAGGGGGGGGVVLDASINVAGGAAGSDWGVESALPSVEFLSVRLVLFLGRPRGLPVPTFPLFAPVGTTSAMFAACACDSTAADSLVANPFIGSCVEAEGPLTANASA